VQVLAVETHFQASSTSMARATFQGPHSLICGLKGQLIRAVCKACRIMQYDFTAWPVAAPLCIIVRHEGNTTQPL